MATTLLKIQEDLNGKKSQTRYWGIKNWHIESNPVDWFWSEPADHIWLDVLNFVLFRCIRLDVAEVWPFWKGDHLREQHTTTSSPVRCFSSSLSFSEITPRRLRSDAFVPVPDVVILGAAASVRELVEIKNFDTKCPPFTRTVQPAPDETVRRRETSE